MIIDMKDNYQGPGKIFDANGMEWKDITWANTETGAMEQQVRNADGTWMMHQGARGTLEPVKKAIKAAAPLLFVPIESRGTTG
jgi:hypothetical protein